jgi:Protein of unknown function (DUF3237)
MTTAAAALPQMPLATEFLFRVVIETTMPLRVPGMPEGDLVVVPIAGGTVTGPGLTGTIVPGGCDLSTVTASGRTELNCSLLIAPQDKPDQRVRMSYTGISLRTGAGSPTPPTRAVGDPHDPGESYFRIAPRFQTDAPDHAMLNGILALGVGCHREKSGPIYDVYRVL